MPSREYIPDIHLAVRFALRELRGGLRGFYIFLGCIALGVAAIGGVNSVAQSITNGIAAEGQAILGGDLSFSLVQREAGPAQKSFLNSNGSITTLITMRGMARLPDGSDQTLVEIKAVDNTYPHYGTFSLAGISTASLEENQVAVDPLLLERLDVEIGGELEIGSEKFTLIAAVDNEPDKVGDNIGFGPRLMMSLEGLEKTGLIQPGSLLRYHYKLKVDDPTDSRIAEITEQAKDRFPDAGWRIRSRDNAAPALTRSVERFSQFLTLVGLTSLIVGGVGVANATRAFLETKRPVIASLKSLGAPGRFVFQLYMVQILIMAGLGILIGLLLATAMPYAARAALSTLLPISQGTLFFPQALAPGILYGVLTTLIFSIWPLAVSQETKPTELFRAASYGENRTLPRLIYIFALVICVIALIACAIWFSDNRFIATVFVGATFASFILLRLVSAGIQWLAKHAPAVRSTSLRMAIANIHRPGSLTPSVILSLGLGLALLVALATIDGNLRNQIENNLPKDAPDFFFVDIQNNEIEPFREKLAEMSPKGKIISVPMLRGRVVSLKGISASEYKAEAGGEWVLRGDRGITYAKRIPENSTLASGEWWPEDYSGPPLVSVSAEEAGELGLRIGDQITINVLGRNISAEISSLREVQWETLGINFVFVFSPNTFTGAPHAHLATLTAGEDSAEAFDGKLLKALAKAFPAVTAVRIRDALETVNGLIAQLSTAIRAAASVALFSSVLVLAGAVAAGNRERVHDAVVLKTLGATRQTLMRMLVLEYTLLGLSTAVFAILAGSLAAWFVISVIMDFNFVIQTTIAATTILASLAFTIVFGLLGTWRILGQKAAPILREL
ncbi:MAG: ABC transporter permease [Rhizobiaceae bacterium]